MNKPRKCLDCFIANECEVSLRNMCGILDNPALSGQAVRGYQLLSLFRLGAVVERLMA